MGSEDYFRTRFAFDSRRRVLWAALYRHYFARYIRPEFTVLELGAGYGYLIKNVNATRRIAVEHIHDDVFASADRFAKPDLNRREVAGRHRCRIIFAARVQAMTIDDFENRLPRKRSGRTHWRMRAPLHKAQAS